MSTEVNVTGQVEKMKPAAVEVVKAEAEKSSIVEFEWEGEKYTFDAELMESDSDILEAFEEEKMIVPVKMLLGVAQYAHFKSKGTNGKRSVSEVADMAKAMFETSKAVTPGE